MSAAKEWLSGGLQQPDDVFAERISWLLELGSRECLRG